MRDNHFPYNLGVNLFSGICDKPCFMGDNLTLNSAITALE